MNPVRRFRAGFTLIELLVVIAIIAILTAILLPVFATVRENARQSNSMSNLRDISQKMEQYKLDNHHYPEVLFGYAFPGSKLSNGLAMAQAYDANYNTAHPGGPASNMALIYFPGLYPAYINDYNVFTDPNNPVDDNSANQTTSQLNVNIIARCDPTIDGTLNGSNPSGTSGTGSSGCSAPAPASGTLVPTTRSFYTRDAYDSSPQVTGTNTVSATFVPRYQTAWETTITDPANFPPTTDPYYRQLRWKNPPSETYVTATTYHVKNADKVLVLFQNGSIKKMTGADFAAQDPTGSPTFWQLKP